LFVGPVVVWSVWRSGWLIYGSPSRASLLRREIFIVPALPRQHYVTHCPLLLLLLLLLIVIARHGLSGDREIIGCRPRNLNHYSQHHIVVSLHFYA